MNIKDFDYFLSLSELQSFTAVAQKFDISQPAVSYAVKRLEEQFSCKLILSDPSHRTFGLTEQGQILLSHIERLLPEVEAARKEINRSLAHCSAIGFPPIIVNYLLSRIDGTSPGAEEVFHHIRTIRGGSARLLHLLQQGDLDASFIASIEPASHDTLRLLPLFDSELYAVVSKSSPLAANSELAFADLLDQPFLMLDQQFIHLQAFQKLNQRYHNQAEILFQTEDVTLLKQMLRKNMGISLLAGIALTEEDRDLVKIPLAGPDRITFHIYLASLQSTILNKDVSRFMSYVQQILAADPQETNPKTDRP